MPLTVHLSSGQNYWFSKIASHRAFHGEFLTLKTLGRWYNQFNGMRWGFFLPEWGNSGFRNIALGYKMREFLFEIP